MEVCEEPAKCMFTLYVHDCFVMDIYNNIKNNKCNGLNLPVNINVLNNDRFSI